MDFISAIGTIAFAFSGYLVGIKKHLDLLGIWIVALLTAIGGGMIRDVLVHRIPLVFYDYTSIVLLTLTLFFAWLIGLHRQNGRLFKTLFLLADSVGLVAFSLIGAQVGLDYQLNAFGVVLLGFITAVGGGVVRDMMVNDIPFILHEDFYGMVAILVAAGLCILEHLGASNAWVLHGLFIAGLAVRLLAHWHDFALPKMGVNNTTENK